MSALTLAELTYEQAQKALEQQERQVNELRQHTGTLLGAAALTASFFGAAALSRDGVGIPVVLAGIALAATVLSGLYVLYPHELKFASDARRLYDRLAPDRDDRERLAPAPRVRTPRRPRAERKAGGSGSCAAFRSRPAPS